MRFRFDWKNFLIGVGAMFIAICLPVISTPFISATTWVREKIGVIKTNQKTQI